MGECTNEIKFLSTDFMKRFIHKFHEWHQFFRAICEISGLLSS